MAEKVTVEEVERVAELAELNQLDTSGVAPLAQVGELGQFSSVPRPDQVEASLDRAAVMSQVPETDGVFFKVPKVIER